MKFLFLCALISLGASATAPSYLGMRSSQINRSLVLTERSGQNRHLDLSMGYWADYRCRLSAPTTADTFEFAPNTVWRVTGGREYYRERRVTEQIPSLLANVVVNHYSPVTTFSLQYGERTASLTCYSTDYKRGNEARLIDRQRLFETLRQTHGINFSADETPNETSVDRVGSGSTPENPEARLPAPDVNNTERSGGKDVNPSTTRRRADGASAAAR